MSNNNQLTTDDDENKNNEVFKDLDGLIALAYAHKHDIKVLSVKPLEDMQYFRIEYYSEIQSSNDVFTVSADSVLRTIDNFMEFNKVVAEVNA